MTTTKVQQILNGEYGIILPCTFVVVQIHSNIRTYKDIFLKNNFREIFFVMVNYQKGSVKLSMKNNSGSLINSHLCDIIKNEYLCVGMSWLLAIKDCCIL